MCVCVCVCRVFMCAYMCVQGLFQGVLSPPLAIDLPIFNMGVALVFATMHLAPLEQNPQINTVCVDECVCMCAIMFVCA